MVTEFGFSEKLGPLRYADNQEEIFLGHAVTQQKHVSDATARLIDEEVRSLIDHAEDRARTILTEQRKELDALATALLEHETLSGSDVRDILSGQPIHRPSPAEEPRDIGRRSSVPSSGNRAAPPGPAPGLEADPHLS